MNKLVPIKVSEETRENLKRIGVKGQTYDQIIRKLLLQFEAFQEEFHKARNE